MQAADVMTFGAASIQSDTPIEEAARLMLEQRVSGLPVVDNRGHLLGMVTEGDLLRRHAGDTAQDRPRWLELMLGSGRADGGLRLARLATVADVMTRPAVTVREADKPQRERSGSQGDAGKIDKDGPGPAARDTPSRRPGPERGRT